MTTADRPTVLGLSRCEVIFGVAVIIVATTASTCHINGRLDDIIAKMDAFNARMAAQYGDIDRNNRIGDTNAGIDDTNARIIETNAPMDARFAEVNSQFAEVNGRLTAILERLVRVETRLDIPPPAPVN